MSCNITIFLKWVNSQCHRNVDGAALVVEFVWEAHLSSWLHVRAMRLSKSAEKITPPRGSPMPKWRTPEPCWIATSRPPWWARTCTCASSRTLSPFSRCIRREDSSSIWATSGWEVPCLPGTMFLWGASR